MLPVDGTYWAYSTNGPLGHLPVLRSTDAEHWAEVGDGMPALAAWVVPGRNWAPEVLRLADDRYVAYYTAAARSGGQAVGRAVAARPEGPYVDESAAPLIDQTDQGGSIDASPFRDADGALYLYWKNDGNAVGVDSWIYGQRLSDDGLSLVDSPHRLIRQDAEWEGPLVEGPALWRRDGRYYLFYSGNAFDTDRYAVGYAVGDSPLGTFTKAPENPILASRGAAAGPGHNSLFAMDGQTWMPYHAWAPDAVGEGGVRTFWLDRVDWVDGRPVVA